MAPVALADRQVVRAAGGGIISTEELLSVTNSEPAQVQAEAREPRCHSCGRLPATHVHFVAAVGRLLVCFEEDYYDILCKECGVALYNRVMKRHLLNTWWSPRALLFGSTIGTTRNLLERNKLLQLAAPSINRVVAIVPATAKATDFPLLDPPPAPPPKKPAAPESPAQNFDADTTPSPPRSLLSDLAILVLLVASHITVFAMGTFVARSQRASVVAAGVVVPVPTVDPADPPLNAPDPIQPPSVADIPVSNAGTLKNEAQPTGELVGRITRIEQDRRGQTLWEVHFSVAVDDLQGKLLSVSRWDEKKGKPNGAPGMMVVIRTRGTVLVGTDAFAARIGENVSVELVPVDSSPSASSLVNEALGQPPPR